MKNPYLLCCAMCLPFYLWGQSDKFSMGFNVGFAWNNIVKAPTESYNFDAFSGAKHINGLALGLEIRQKVNSYLALSTGLQYSERGFTYASPGTGIERQTFDYVYLSIPIIAGVKVWKGIGVHGGLELARLQSLRSGPDLDPRVISLKKILNPDSYSYAFILGLEYQYKKNFFMALRQYFGPFKAVDLEVSDDFGRSYESIYHHSSIQISVGYRFFIPSGS